jgi:Protein of unknown function (DUF3072)
MSESSTGANDVGRNTEYSSVPEEHGQAEQDALPDLVESQGVNAGSGQEASSEATAGGDADVTSDSGGSDDVIGASQPGEASTTVKDPSDWVTGDEPMTGAQRSYLETLARQAGEQLPADLTKAQASEHIDRLQAQTGRGQ